MQSVLRPLLLERRDALLGPETLHIADEVVTCGWHHTLWSSSIDKLLGWVTYGVRLGFFHTTYNCDVNVTIPTSKTISAFYKISHKCLSGEDEVSRELEAASLLVITIHPRSLTASQGERRIFMNSSIKFSRTCLYSDRVSSQCAENTF